MTEIEQAAVAQFVAQAQTATPDERKVVIERLSRFVGRSERMTYKGHKMSDEALQAAIDQITAMDAPQAEPEVEQARPGVAICRVDPKNFAKGVKYAKQFGGTFDPTSKTWRIPLDREIVRDSLTAARAYGLILVEGK